MDPSLLNIGPVTSNRFEQYAPAKPLANGSVTLERRQTVPLSYDKRASKIRPQKVVCCFCYKTTKYKRKRFIVGTITNMAIFALLICYTFLGSVIFLAIEGNHDTPKPRLLPDISSNYTNKSIDFKLSGNYLTNVRKKTVENIWEITVSLNILYRENWTALAAEELLKFQNELLSRISLDMSAGEVESFREMAVGEVMDYRHFEYEWNLALAFFYSLTVLTTIGYGNIVPRTILGKGATVLYAIFGIPLTLAYLSCVGAHLSKLARSVFTRALCCCLCSNCGYCCYDEKRMAEKERKMKLKRQKEELETKQSTELIHQPNNDKQITTDPLSDEDAISWPDTDSKVSMHGLSIFAPILLCLCAISIYIILGSIVLLKIDDMKLLDGLYFCFTALTTIGFGDIMPGISIHVENGVKYYMTDSRIIWFCSCYTLTGLAFTAMCFGVIHDEIIHRIRHKQSAWLEKGNAVNDEVNIKDPFFMVS